MRKLFQISESERKELFIEAGIRLGLPPFYVEKDFWVVWTLSVLFDSTHSIDKNLVFCGGTSLSKAWNCIHRFSEDIDLSLVPYLDHFNFEFLNGTTSEKEKTLKN